MTEVNESHLVGLELALDLWESSEGPSAHYSQLARGKRDESAD